MLLSVHFKCVFSRSDSKRTNNGGTQLVLLTVYLLIPLASLAVEEADWIGGAQLVLGREADQIALHGVGVFAIGVILGLDFVDGESQGVGVQMQGGAIALSDVKGDVLGVEALDHGSRRLVHELLGEP